MHSQKKITQPFQNCIGPTIRIGRDILCLPYAGIFKKIKQFHLVFLHVIILHTVFAASPHPLYTVLAASLHWSQLAWSVQQYTVQLYGCTTVHCRIV